MGIFVAVLMFATLGGSLLVTVSVQQPINTIQETPLQTADTYTKTWNVTWGGANADDSYGGYVDSLGNIYVTGSTNSLGDTLGDLILIKYAPNGTRLWNISWTAPGCRCTKWGR